MLSNDELLDQLKKKKILIGPDHFVVGDGYGNPGRHTAIWIDGFRFYRNPDIHKECTLRISNAVKHLKPEVIVTSSDQSFPTARWLSVGLAEKNELSNISVFSLQGEIPETARGRTLIHDDVVNHGKKIGNTIKELQKDPKRFRIVGISSLFLRIEGIDFLGYPLYPALETPMPTYPQNACPLCKEGVPINTAWGVGQQFLDQKK